MTDVFGLLTLPNTSTAFTAIKSDTFDGSASPRRKAARLDTDSDVSSASRSNRTQQRGPLYSDGKVNDTLVPRFRKGDEQSKLLLLQRSIKLILTPFEESGLNDPRSLLPDTTSYEDVFVACQSAVTIANTGEVLYDKLRLELEQSIGRVATSLASEKLNENENNEDGPVLWLKKFAQVCEWFDSRIGKHSNHKLHWDHALGTATLVGRFKPGNKELSVSLYQALVLLLFNSAEEWRYRDILEQTRIEPAELKRVLQSLACAKKKVLKKLPPGRDVDETDSFRFNVDFQDIHAKVHINSIQAKILPEESIRTNESIEGDRVYYLEAAIVRVMKARKELTYEQLKAATIEAVKNHFVPTVDSIKKRIDVLVEREFLERSDEDKNKFKYIA
ncbi:hypothetical protein H0H93_007074 [Arthromyces matolae]|nr:hypothetical protein H0H93_007074 [Arthromyces matolae]